MQSNICSITLKAILAIATLTLLAMATPANAGETILLSFNGTSDGRFPVSAPLVFDAAGNLYGASATRGANGTGTAFGLNPNGSGGWAEPVLPIFSSLSGYGNEPLSGLVLHAAGRRDGQTARRCPPQ